MSTQILMPALSPTMTEGKLAKWLKNIGDDVRAGDVIAEIETDKATMEVEAVDEGKLARLLVDEGTEGIAVNTPIAVLSMNGEDVTAAPPQAPQVSSPAQAPVSSPAPQVSSPAPQLSSPAPQVSSPAQHALGGGRGAWDPRLFAVCCARKFMGARTTSGDGTVRTVCQRHESIGILIAG